MDTQSILKTAIAEHEDSQKNGVSLESLSADVEAQLKDLKSVRSSFCWAYVQIPAYHESSEPLSIVSFRCMLQDTGYPMEVYMPTSEGSTSGEMDLSKLKERWIGWAVEWVMTVVVANDRVPGEQAWLGKAPKAQNGSQAQRSLPKEVHSKYPIPGNEGKYLGALVKVR
jgi:hypothetical protein